MPRTNSTPALLCALILAFAASTLGACGSGSDSLVHVDGASATITQPMLDHWMRAMAGGDFRANIGTKGPANLVSEPADYGACEAAARKIVPHAFSGKPVLGTAQIARKCRELHAAIKEQALSFLLSVAWTVEEGEEFGLKVSAAELEREFARYRRHPYPTEADLRRFLAERQWKRSDILYQLKRNILVRQILPKFEARVKRAGGGEAVYAKLALERYRKLIAKTTCKTGYVVQGCREYREPSTPPLSPAVILEQFAHGTSS